MGHMAATLAIRLQGTLLSNTERNPKEQANTITLRSGRQLEKKQPKNANTEAQKGIRREIKRKAESQRMT